jgi:hypothetical protein
MEVDAMSMRSGHPVRPTPEARAPRLPGVPATRPTIQSQSLICWRTVVVVGGIAWFVVAGLAAAVWTVGHQKAAHYQRMSAASVEQLAAPAPRAPQLEQLPDATKAIAEQDLNGVVASFRKAPASPPLPVGEDERVVAIPVLPLSEQGLSGQPADFETHGTQVAFAGNPSEAARLAARDRKLLFVLHLSGNFEDANFT